MELLFSPSRLIQHLPAPPPALPPLQLTPLSALKRWDAELNPDDDEEASAAAIAEALESAAASAAASSSDQPAPAISQSIQFESHPLLNHKLVLCQGDILGFQTDALVHSTNERLSDVVHAHAARPGSLAQRLCAYAGPVFRSECQGLVAVEGCVATGDASLMPSHSLGQVHRGARFVVHTVSPKYSDRFRIAAENALHGCIRRSLEVALDAGLGSIAFPLVHASSKQFPIEHAAHVCARTLRRFLERYGRETIHTVVLCFQHGTPEAAAAAAAAASSAASAASAASSSSAAAAPPAPLTCNEDEIFAIYSRILPLYFPRSAAEEALQLRFLPADIGDEVGATVVKERAIRIAEGFIARGPRPFSEEERNEMQAKRADVSAAAASAAASSSSSSAAASASLVAPPHRSSFDPVCALPSSLLPSRAEYVAAEEVPPEPAVAARKGLVGAAGANSSNGYPGQSAAPSPAPAPILYRDDASSFSLAQEHPDTKRRREYLTSSTPADRALESLENARFYDYLKRAQSADGIDFDILDDCSYLYESQRADQLGRRIIYVVPARIPLNRRDGSANLSGEHLCAHAIRTLEPLMSHPFVMIVFAPPPASSALHCPPSSWFRHFASLLTRTHKSNLKHLLILGADWRLRSHILWFCTFHSGGSAADKSLWSKIVYVANLDELYSIIKPKEMLEIPPEISEAEARNNGATGSSGGGAAAVKGRRSGEEDSL